MDAVLTKKILPPASKETWSDQLAQSGIRSNSVVRLFDAERRYLDAVPADKRAQLESRYNDPKSQLESGVRQSFLEECIKHNVAFRETPSTLHGKTYLEGINEVRLCLNEKIRAFFPEDTRTTFQETKEAMVLRQTHRYLRLLEKAINGGEISKEISATDVFRLAEANIIALRLQETASMETSLGDHGVRHLIDHNIDVCEKVTDKVAGFGIKGLTALRRLMMHQVMLVHDLGYAMSSVRDAINEEGPKGQDFGHNLLAAQYMRQLTSEPESPLLRIFGRQNIEMMHHAVLYHDRSADGRPDIVFSNQRDTRQTLTSIIQLADNTAAFSSKLAALIYEVPETLLYMRLMKTAHEIGDEKIMQSLKERLIDSIDSKTAIPLTEKNALQQSVRMLKGSDFQYSVGRLAGTEPEFSAFQTSEGSIGVQISVKESSIHRQMLSTFAMPEYKQLVKFIKDLTDQKVDISKNSDLTVIDTPSLKIEVRTGSQKDIDPNNRFEAAAEALLGSRPLLEYQKLDDMIMGNLKRNGSELKPGEMENVLSMRGRLLREFIPKILAAEFDLTVT